ncbi:hypothetical protein PIB30_052645 [Stylosanthes scabra]|uniref:Uncharacterized protein n=1 Tax=Stylosanthes scabra TaxID=79078 RepID=A0ABU6XJF8_9FABA|nr:hypothetical protein [Stylosanthes scabra]
MQHMSNSDPNHRNRPPSPDTKPLPPCTMPKFCGETNATDSGQLVLPPMPPQPAPANTDLEAARPRPPANGVPPLTDTVPPAAAKKRRDSDGGTKGSVPSTNGQAPPPATTAATPVDQPQHARRVARHEEAVDVEDDEFVPRQSHMKYELRDSPGLGKFCLELLISFSVGTECTFEGFWDYRRNRMCQDGRLEVYVKGRCALAELRQIRIWEFS